MPTNGCLSDKKDRALSLCLLAAFRASDSITASSTISNDVIELSRDRESFQTSMITELKAMGVQEPLCSIKEGGVGKDTIDYVVDRFLYSTRHDGQCPATVSVIGALAAQEAIKAITSVHVPITQFLMFESLDSVLLPLFPSPSTLNTVDTTPSTSTATSTSTSTSTSTTSTSTTESTSAAALVYGEEVATELAALRVFVVGSGAIGCELLKTFALLGVGIGSSPSSEDNVEAGSEGGSKTRSDTEDEDLTGLWSGLSKGGIVLADMDQIERSNLNRQLLFREKHVGKAKAVVAAETIKEVCCANLIYANTSHSFPVI